MWLYFNFDRQSTVVVVVEVKLLQLLVLQIYSQNSPRILHDIRMGMKVVNIKTERREE